MHTHPMPQKRLVFRLPEFEKYATERGWGSMDHELGAALGLHRTSVRSVRRGGEVGKKFQDLLIADAAAHRGISPGAAFDLFFELCDELSAAA